MVAVLQGFLGLDPPGKLGAIIEIASSWSGIGPRLPRLIEISYKIFLPRMNNLLAKPVLVA